MRNNSKKYLDASRRKKLDEDVFPLRALLENFAKISVGAAFCVYAAGFIIWHSFLGQYGVSSSGNIQVEFLSAAACYIVILLLFTLPPVLIIRFADLKNDENWSIYAMVMAWYLALTQVSNIMFPAPPQVGTETFFIFEIMALHFAAALAAKKLVPTGVLQKWLYNRVWFAIYMLSSAIVTIVMSPASDLLFLVTTMLLYFIGAQYGINAFAVASERTYTGFTLKAVVIIAIMISHCFLFGRTQFGKIPRVAGGGRPEIAYISIKKEKVNDLRNLLPFHSRQTLAGPVEVLERTDHELVVALPRDAATGKKYAIVLHNDVFDVS